jgi:hypothetical protein
MNVAAFLRDAIEAFPYKSHAILTDNGIAFADLPNNRRGPTALLPAATRTALGASWPNPISWTNGQAERTNRTIKDATLKVFHYPDLDGLKAHVLAFVRTYNFAKHPKALRWKTPFEAISQSSIQTKAGFKPLALSILAKPSAILFISW